MHLVYPLLPLPKRNCITIVSSFSWILQSYQEKSKVMVMQNFGVNKVHYGLSENGEFSSFHPGSSWDNWTTRTPRGERTDGKYIHTVLHVLFDLVAYICMLLNWRGTFFFLVFFELVKMGPGACFSNVPVTFRARKVILCLPCLHLRSKFQ